MKLAYLGFYLMEIRTLWATCESNLVWAITWAPGVRIKRFNSPREDIGIFYKYKVAQLSKDKWISPESGLKVSLRISFQNPNCFRKIYLFFKETIKTLLLLGFVWLETYWILCIERRRERERKLFERTWAKIEGIQSKFERFRQVVFSSLLYSFDMISVIYIFVFSLIVMGN